MSRATFARVLADHAWSGSRTLALPEDRAVLPAIVERLDVVLLVVGLVLAVVL